MLMILKKKILLLFKVEKFLFAMKDGLTLFLLMTTQEAFVDSVDQDQTAQNVQSDM